MRTIAIALLAVPALAFAQDLGADLQQIDALWMGRDQDENVRKMRELAQQLHQKNPDNPEVLWRYARAVWHQSEQSKNGETKKKLAEECWQVAERCEKLAPKNANCPYHVGLCIGEYSYGIGIIQAVWEGIEGKFKGAHERAIKLDEKVGEGGPWNSIGRMYWEMPWPKRDLKESIRYLKEAMRVNPANYRGLVFMAESYLAMDEPKEALKWVDKVLNDPVPGKDPYEERKAQTDARALKKKIEEAIK